MSEKKSSISTTSTSSSSSSRRSSGNDASPLRVMQWNVLADGLAQFGDFVRAPKEVLDWSTRAPKLLNKILEAAADIICLQELNHYDDFFLPQMQQHGYAGIFKPKRPSPAARYGCPADGSAVFYKASRLLVEREIGMKHGVICCFKSLQADQKLVVAATHLKAKSGKENDAIRLKQVQELLQNLTECTDGGALPSIICGDFNTNPFSEVYNLVHEHSLRFQSVYARHPDGGETYKGSRIDKGETQGNGLEKEEQQKLVTEDGKTFPSIALSKSSDGGSGAEPPFTTWKTRSTGEKRETIDYIWFSECTTLTPDRLWRLPTEASIGPEGLPSEAMPSDHLPLLCEFRWGKKKESPDKNHDPVRADLHYLNVPQIGSTEILVALKQG